MDKENPLLPGEQDILNKMTACLSTLEQAHQEMARIQHDNDFKARQEKARIIIAAGRVDLVLNEKLKQNLIKINRGVNKKLTSEILNAAVYIETIEYSKPYYAAQQKAEQAKAELNAIETILMEYQSIRKFRGKELDNLV